MINIQVSVNEKNQMNHNNSEAIAALFACVHICIYVCCYVHVHIWAVMVTVNIRFSIVWDYGEGIA